MIWRENSYRMALWATLLIVPAAHAVNDVTLTVAPGSDVVAPGDPTTVLLEVSNLAVPINGIQVFFSYDTALLSLVSITPDATAGGGTGWTEILESDVSGDVSYIAVILGASEGSDHVAATIELTALAEGTTSLTFLPDDAPQVNKLTDASDGSDITPTLNDSGTILITCDDGNPCTGDSFALGSCVYIDEPAGTACGDPSSAVCDNPDSCDGMGACQPNFEPASTECRASAGDCDIAEFCTGAGPGCPADDLLPDTTECRTAAGDCDVAEFCTGMAVVCPADDLVPDGTECRAAADDCDVAESCDGMNVDCPADDFALVGTECRPAASDCDVAEFCTGMDSACPTDDLAPAGAPCGDNSTTLCDNPDSCDGMGTCLPNFEPGTTACRPLAGDCDVAEFCTVRSATCPADDLLPDTTECRAAGGDCDVAEFCTGMAATCPADDLVPDGTECRAAVDDCDVAEACDGMNVDCPADDLALAGTECRPAASECDVAEVCTGMDSACPADDFAMSGTPCGDATDTLCDNPDSCDGSGGCLDNFEPSGTPCDDGDPCNGAETCDGMGVCMDGPITDCNMNDIEDSCDIDSGFSLDDNGNGIPDECETALCPGGTIAECADTDNDDLRDDPCLWYACVAGACETLERTAGQADMGGQFGECMIDLACDGNDRFLALNCFAGQDPDGSPFSCEDAPPMALNVDAGGQFGSCVLDSVCDGNDAFAALNCFSDDYDCTCPAGPAPLTPLAPTIIGRATLRASADEPNITPGGVVYIDVLLDTPLADLRGYQLHLDATGGQRGHLRLIDIVIDRRPAFDADWQAFNVHTRQMVAGVDTVGMAMPAGSYLATFVYRASADATGRFVIDILDDPDDPAQRSFLFPTAPRGQIVTTTVPATIVVGGSKVGPSSFDQSR